jgi:trans-aconitate methyltransferase
MMNKQNLWDGQYYKTHSSPYERSSRVLIEGMTLQGNESILDVGCGDGKVTAFIASRVPQGHVIGVDSSPSMIEVARRDHTQVKNLSFEVVDAIDIDFDQQCDCVVSFSALHWVQDQLRALKHIHRALKSGGFAMLKVGCCEDSAQSRAMQEVRSRPTWKNYFEQQPERYFGKTKIEYESMLKQAGFKNAQVTMCYPTRTIESVESLQDWLMGWMPADTGLPHDRCLLFAREVAENIYQQCGVPLDGPVSYPNPFLYVEARK